MSALGDVANQLERAQLRLSAAASKADGWRDDQRKRFEASHLAPITESTNRFRLVLWELDALLDRAENELRRS